MVWLIWPFGRQGAWFREALERTLDKAARLGVFFWNNIDLWGRKTSKLQESESPKNKTHHEISLVYHFGHPASVDFHPFFVYTTSCCSFFLQVVSKSPSLLHKSSKKHMKTPLFFEIHSMNPVISGYLTI
jgi:hypothetical protein